MLNSRLQSFGVIDIFGLIFRIMRAKGDQISVLDEPLTSNRPTKRQRNTRASNRVAAELVAEESGAQNAQINSASKRHPDVDNYCESLVPAPAPTGDVELVAELSVRDAAQDKPQPVGDFEKEMPPAKRHRASRIKILPAPLRPGDLEIYDRASGPYHSDTDEGHYVFNIGENLTPRFKIMRKFGEGTFGRVVECWDRRRSGYVAVKIIRNVEKYREAAMIELQVLATLAQNDPDRRRPIVQLLEWFDYRNHVCMVFERLGFSIYDCLRRNAYKAFPLTMARDLMRQVLEAVEFMHSLSMVHTDLKPENILFLSDDIVTIHPPYGAK